MEENNFIGRRRRLPVTRAASGHADPAGIANPAKMHYFHAPLNLKYPAHA